MLSSALRQKVSRLDLQAKVVLVLILVIAPTYLIVSLAVMQLTVPFVKEEMRALGVHAANGIADQILARRSLLLQGKQKNLEEILSEVFSHQPMLLQIDVYRRAPDGSAELAATTEDTSMAVPPAGGVFPPKIISQEKAFEDGREYWEIWAPIKTKKGIFGAIRLEVSAQNASNLGPALAKMMMIAGAVNIVLLIGALSFFLRKTITNDRKLRETESKNLTLSQQLREAERKMMVQEKLAVMGQLTASFAHEIGTPLNSVSGHLQLLDEDLREKGVNPVWSKRLGIISDQLIKIENIVKGFLQSTSNPPSEKQLLDFNQLMERSIAIIRPRVDSMGVRVERSFDKRLGPMRAVPLEIEQLLLNLLNNSLDSLQAKLKASPGAAAKIEVFSRHKKDGIKEWIELGVFDSGEGIPKRDLPQVFRPFFTTKGVGEGTGLGLSICQEIAAKYNGKLILESKEGSWTRATFRVPYGVNA